MRDTSLPLYSQGALSPELVACAALTDTWEPLVGPPRATEGHCEPTVSAGRAH